MDDDLPHTLLLESNDILEDRIMALEGASANFYQNRPTGIGFLSDGGLLLRRVRLVLRPVFAALMQSTGHVCA
jgi:hypothetical protein